MKKNSSTSKRWLCLAVTVVLLSACAGTQVNHLNEGPTLVRNTPPQTIAVVTESALIPPRHESKATQQTQADQTAALLDDSLRHTLAAHGLHIVDASQHPDLILRCRIIDVRGGSKTLRLMVGYGAGKAILQLKVFLEAPEASDAEALLSFDTDSSSGGMPGTGFSLPGLVGAGLGSFKKEGLPKATEQTVEHIDQELGKYFLAQHWPYPPPVVQNGGKTASTREALGHD